MEVRFHCTAATRRAAEKSKHRILTECVRVKQVLRANPDYGIVIPGFAPLRKMRVQVPAFGLGKSGGYRAIYQSATVDEEIYVVLLATYFKGDREDLDQTTYKELKEAAAEILGNVIDYEWEL